MKLSCTNCGSSFETFDSPRIIKGDNGNEYTCPVCAFYPNRAGVSTEQSLTAITDFEQFIRQTLIQARASGVQDSEIISVLKSELEFAAEIGGMGHSFLVQLIDLGSHENSNGPDPIPESRDSHQMESTNK
jgi:hypothetical protein